MPAERLPERPANQRREEAADVHTHIIDVVGPAAARVVGTVKVVDLARQAGKEQPVAERDRRQRDIEQGLERHHEMASGHGCRADDDRAFLAQVAVGDDAADDRREIGERRVCAVDERGMLLRDEQLPGHVVDQQRPHSVI